MNDPERVLQIVADLRAIAPPLSRLHAMHRGMLDAAGLVTTAEAYHYGMNLVAESMATLVRNGVSARDLVAAVALTLAGAMPPQSATEAGLEEISEETPNAA